MKPKDNVPFNVWMTPEQWELLKLAAEQSRVGRVQFAAAAIEDVARRFLAEVGYRIVPEKMYRRESCKFCSKELPPEQRYGPDREFCSNKCRQANYRSNQARYKSRNSKA